MHSKTRLFPAFQFRIQLRGCAGLGSHTADPLDLKFSNDTSVKFGKIIVFFFLIFGPGYLVAVNRIERLRTRIWGDVPSTLYRSLNAFSKVLFRGLFGSYCSSGGPGFPCGRFHESPPEKSAFPKSDYTRQFALFCFPPHPLTMKRVSE